ncbi:MAG: hypothetical protein JJU05_07575 [Verrucomicrobia bacterium]|nr:hypothetical protein [Verrucomicrobiota bacterium]MCH8527786.1 hypothetical protein [Kiritimatiellia bacterium]
MSSRTLFQNATPRETAVRLLPVLSAFLLALLCSALFSRGEVLFEEETAYVFQANTLKTGVFRQTYPVLGPWLSESGLVLHRDGGWFAPVPPGHALWLIPGVWAGFPGLMSALAAGGTVFLMTLIGIRLRFSPLLLPVLMLVSPFFLFLHGTLLPQTTGMFLSTLFLWAYIRMIQSPGIRGSLGCGLAWGLLFFTHPWNALLLAIPFALHWLAQWPRTWKTAVPWGRTLLFGIGILPGVLLLLWYFRELTLDTTLLAGEALQHRVNGWLPFQAGGTGGGGDPQSMRRGLSLLWRHVRLMDQWLFGTPRFTLLLWLGLAGHGWNRRWSPLLLGVTLVMFFGYVAWPQLDTTLGGPRYQAPMLPFFILFGAMGIHQIWRQLEGVHSVRMFLFLFLGLWGGLSSIEFLREKYQDVHEQLGTYFQVQEALAAPDRPLLLFYRDPFPDSRYARALIGANTDGMNTPVLRVRAPLGQRAGIRDAFPGRVAVTLEDETLELIPFAESFQDIERAGHDAHLAPGSGENTADGRSANSAAHQPGYLFFGWYPFLPPGRYEIRFDLRWEQIRPELPTRLEVMTDLGLKTLAVTEITGGLTSTTLDFSLSEGRQIEPRVVFGGSGTIHLRRVIVRRLGPLEPEPERIP